MFLVGHYLLRHLFSRLTGSVFGCTSVKA